jgi:hypothetical protein
MPYATAADVPSYVPESKREHWRAVWNSRYKEEIDSGKSKEAAEQAAFRLANGVVLSDLSNLATLSLPDKLSALRADLDKLNLSDLPEHLKTAGRKRIVELAQENGVELSALLAENDSAKQFLIVDDKGNGHLKVRQSPAGPLDHGLMGGAYAALFKNYRGNAYEGPGKEEAKAKLHSLYKQEKMDWPGEKEMSDRHFAARFIPKRIELSFIGNDPQDGSPLYEHPIATTGRWFKGGAPFSLSLADFETIVSNHQKLANGEVNLDYDHASEHTREAQGQPIPAAGWVRNLRIIRNSDGGTLMGTFKFTPRAAKMIADEEYKYLSAGIYLQSQDKDTGQLQGPILHSVALTNQPFQEHLPPLHLTEVQFSPAAILLTDLEGAKTMTKKEQVADWMGRVVVLGKEGKIEEAAKLLSDASKLLLDDSAPAVMDDTTHLIIKKGKDGKHAIMHGDKPVGFLTAKELDDYQKSNGNGNGDADEKDGKEMSDYLKTEKLTLSDARQLIEKGKTADAVQLAGKGKALLLSDCVSERGVFDKSKASMLASSNPGRITMADYIALDEANGILDEAVRAGKLAPAFRKELFADVAGDPAKWKKIFASAVPFINVNKGMGVAGGETPLSAGAEIEKRVNVMLSDDKQNKGPNGKLLTKGDLTRKVFEQDPELRDRYRAEARSKKVGAEQP